MLTFEFRREAAPSRAVGSWMPIAVKRGIIKEHVARPELLQRELAAWAKVVFKLRRVPAQTTISDILHNADKIMSETYGDDKCYRPVRVTSPLLESRLWSWVQEMERCNLCLSRELIRLKARSLQVTLGDAWDLALSDGWLTAFEKCHGLRLRQQYGEAASADPETVRLGRERLQELVELFAKQPRCFEKRTAEELGFLYRNNAKAWMISVIFQEWLQYLARDMRAAGRFILLLLDNASSHKVGDLLCTNVQVDFLPPNTTAFLQSIDAGIIAAFMRGYRRKQLLHVYEKVKDFDRTTHEQNLQLLGNKPYGVDQLQAMKWSREVWSEVPAQRTIKHCFEHTGICFRSGEEDANSCSYDSGTGVEEVFMQMHF